MTEYGKMFTMHEQTNIDLDFIKEFLDIIENYFEKGKISLRTVRCQVDPKLFLARTSKLALDLTTKKPKPVWFLTHSARGSFA